MVGVQSFLIDSRLLSKAIEVAGCSTDDVVFVAGGDNGQLASMLSNTCRIMIVEPDESISRYLYTLELYHSMVINSQPHLVMGDIPFDKLLCLQPTLTNNQFFSSMLRVKFDSAVLMLTQHSLALFRSRDMLGALLRANYDLNVLLQVPKISFSPPLDEPAKLSVITPKRRPDPVAKSLQLLANESGTIRGLLTRSCREFFGYTLAEAQDAVRILDTELLRKRFQDLGEEEFKSIYDWLKMG